MLRTVRTKSRRIHIVVPLNVGYTQTLVVSFQGVRSLHLAPASRRVTVSAPRPVDPDVVPARNRSAG